MELRGNFEFEPSGFFVVRTPLLPWHELESWSEGLAAPAASKEGLSAALAADRLKLRERLRAAVLRPEVREAIFVASPNLEASVETWLREPETERGAGLDVASFQLDREVTGAGRTEGTILFPDDPCLAPRHATFLYREGSLHLRDEGAPGGTYLRLRGPSVPLRPGDLFAVGVRLLRYAGSLPQPAPGPPDGTRRLGAPRPPSPTVVIEELLEGGVTGRVFVRGGGSITIGRSGCAVNLGDDPELSQAHAELVVDSAGGARLKDLGSAHGTFIRIPPHAERELHDGDWLRLGREVLRVEIAG